MRPVYETDGDRDREKSVITYACSVWKCEAMRMPKMYPVDWSLQRNGSIKAFAEVKWRYKSYSTYIISAHKWHTAISLAKAFDLIALLLVCWPDQAGVRHVIWTQMKPENMKRLVHAGRTDRGDAQDLEPCVEIDVSKFNLLKKQI